MELKTFKKIVDNVFLENKFSKNGGYYVQDNSEILIVVGLQKSNYSRGYYINVGYVIKKLHQSIEKVKDADGDVRTRFSFESEGNQTDFFEFEKFDENAQDIVIDILKKNFNQYIMPAVSLDGLRILLKENPVLLYQTSLHAKEFLGFQE